MKKSNRFSLEVRERAARIKQGLRSEYPFLWTAIESNATSSDADGWSNLYAD